MTCFDQSRSTEFDEQGGGLRLGYSESPSDGDWREAARNTYVCNKNVAFVGGVTGLWQILILFFMADFSLSIGVAELCGIIQGGHQ